VRSAISRRAPVELIVSGADPTGQSFYFLEMNTRLQVEHPVTEMVTGLDLVEQMIRVAAGEPLGFTQDDVKLTGWSIENRVYAEDPYRGFLPSTGRLVRYQPPRADLHQAPFGSDEGFSTSLETNGEGGGGQPSPFASSEVEKRSRPRTTRSVVRVDDGVFEGGEVSMFYDPMIAKLVTYAGTREEAIDRQVEALDSFVIEGIGHNVDFLSALMQHPRFRAGEITTGFIAEEYPEGFQGAPAGRRADPGPRRHCRLARWKRRARPFDQRPARASLPPAPERGSGIGAKPSCQLPRASKAAISAIRRGRRRRLIGPLADPPKPFKGLDRLAASRTCAGPAVGGRQWR
jgi:acetyl/propionyl-CoA carboxylase alpha subunit